MCATACETLHQHTFFLPGKKEVEAAVEVLQRTLCKDDWPGFDSATCSADDIDVREIVFKTSEYKMPVYQRPTFELIATYAAGPQGNVHYITRPWVPQGAAVIKIVLTTNLLENGVTPQNVVVVLNPRTAKRSLSYGACDYLGLVQITSSEDKQRNGRAGRTMPGIVLELRDDYLSSVARAQNYTGDMIAEFFLNMCARCVLQG